MKDSIVHFIAIFNVDQCTPYIIVDIVLHSRQVCSMQSSASLMTIFNSIADDFAVSTFRNQMQMDAVFSQNTTLATLFDPCVLQREHGARSSRNCVQAECTFASVDTIPARTVIGLSRIVWSVAGCMVHAIHVLKIVSSDENITRKVNDLSLHESRHVGPCKLGFRFKK